MLNGRQHLANMNFKSLPKIRFQHKINITQSSIPLISKYGISSTQYPVTFQVVNLLLSENHHNNRGFVSTLMGCTYPNSLNNNRRLGSTVTGRPYYNYPIHGILKRHFYHGRGPNWENSKPLATKILVGLAGIGALIVFSTVGVAFVVTGAIGVGAYSLYKRLRSNADSWMQTPFKGNNVLQKYMQSAMSKTPKTSGSSIFGLPLIATAALQLISKLMMPSFARVGQMQSTIHEKIVLNQEALRLLGSDIVVNAPRMLSESVVNGNGKVEASIPIANKNGQHSEVHIIASIKNEELHYKKMELHVAHSRRMVDLLDDHRSSVTIMDAEFKDI